MTDDLIEAIRAAVATEATPGARTAGIAACRTILTALGGEAGEPFAAPTPPVQIGPTANAIAALIRSTPPDHLFELLIAKLSTIVPQDAKPTPTHKMTIPFVKVPTP
jgi:hypothetical protein